MAVRFGLIGFGAWGRFHARAIAEAASAELVAVAADSDASAADAAAAYPGIPVDRDYRDLLRRDDVEAVTIVLPNALHERVAVAALEAGKHVLLEKPMALDAAACTRIDGVARAQRRVLNVVHQLRLSPQWGRIKRWIDEGVLGQVQYVNVSLFRRSFRSGARGWRYDAPHVGSWLLEELVHYADLATWYLADEGEPETVMAMASGPATGSTLWRNTSMMLRWPSGAYAVLSQCLAGFDHHQLFEVAGTRGAARATWSAAMDRAGEATATLRCIGGLTGEERFDIGEPTDVALDAGVGEVADLAALIDAVADGIATGTACVPAAAARRAVAVCDAAARSIASDAPVRLEAAA